MATRRDESNNVERDELETQGGLNANTQAANATETKRASERGEVGSAKGHPIEGLDDSEDPTGGAGGP
jgi:hypothetical protein